MTSMILICVSGIAGIILLNILLMKYIKDKAVKNYVAPFLKGKGLELHKVELAGLFSKGDFKNEESSFLPIFMEGFPINETYIYLYVSKKGGLSQTRITAKVRTLFLSVKKVTYKPEI